MTKVDCQCPDCRCREKLNVVSKQDMEYFLANNSGEKSRIPLLKASNDSMICTGCLVGKHTRKN